MDEWRNDKMSEPFEFVQDTLRTAKIKHGYVLKSMEEGEKR